VNVCVIGVGNFGGFLLSKLGENKSYHVLCCYHPDPAKAGTFGRLRGVSDLRLALDEPGLDAVIIATPNDNHHQMILEAIKANKHVFVEKPVTSTYSDALDVARRLGSNKGGVFMVGHNHRRKACIRKVRCLLDEGRIGRLVNVTMNLSHGGAYNILPSSWRADPKRHREGPLITAGSHLIDTIHYLLGPIKSVHSVIGNISGKTRSPDSNATLFEMGSGATVFMQANYSIPSEDEYAFYGTEGTIYVSRDSVSLRLGRDDNVNGQFIPTTPVEIPIAKTDTFKEELDEFYNAVSDGSKIETGIREGLNVMAVIDACYLSHKGRRIVVMDEYPDYSVPRQR
jgi:predicted dehydrogenase